MTTESIRGISDIAQDERRAKKELRAPFFGPRVLTNLAEMIVYGRRVGGMMRIPALESAGKTWRVTNLYTDPSRTRYTEAVNLEGGKIRYHKTVDTWSEQDQYGNLLDLERPTYHLERLA